MELLLRSGSHNNQFIIVQMDRLLFADAMAHPPHPLFTNVSLKWKKNEENITIIRVNKTLANTIKHIDESNNNLFSFQKTSPEIHYSSTSPATKQTLREWLNLWNIC